MTETRIFIFAKVACQTFKRNFHDQSVRVTRGMQRAKS